MMHTKNRHDTFLEELDVKGRLTKGNLNFFNKPNFFEEVQRRRRIKGRKRENDGSDFY